MYLELRSVDRSWEQKQEQNRGIGCSGNENEGGTVGARVVEVEVEQR